MKKNKLMVVGAHCDDIETMTVTVLHRESFLRHFADAVWVIRSQGVFLAERQVLLL